MRLNKKFGWDLKHFSESSYTRSVIKSTQRLEALLKVVVTPQVRNHQIISDAN